MSTTQRKSVLFVPEAGILAHVGRSLAVARAMDAGAFDIAFAATGSHAHWIGDAGYDALPIHTRPREELLARLKRGTSAFEESVLREYVADEIRLLNEVKPDVVVGDFRPSLAISATVVGVPYACITNAVWSRHIAFKLDPPESWLPTRLLGKPIMRLLSSLLEKRVFAMYAKPFNRVRAEHGLPPKDDIRDCMCSDDLTLFADVPEFFPTRDLPAHVRYVGPIVWQPDNPLPDWWDRLDRSGAKKTVYVTMGSTGPVGEIKRIVLDLLDCGYQVICTSIGEDDPELAARDGCFQRHYLPGGAMCEAADVVVCHAGNGTIYQALGRGTPVVGMAEFHDQDFNMQRVAALDLGRRARSAGEVSKRVAEVLADEACLRNARELRDAMAAHDGPVEAARAIAEFAAT